MKFHLFLCLLLLASCTFTTQDKTASNNDWQLLPFVKVDAANPVLGPNAGATFFCPVRKEVVRWEEKDVFNPSAVVRDGKVYLLYRAEDVVGKHAGTSRLGLATSKDGLNFERMPEPFFFPDEDGMKVYEWEGGIEDPRLVEDEKGNYILTYTAYDGHVARLCVASSNDLLHWQKHGLAFAKSDDDKYLDLWSKSGSIITKQQGKRFIAKKINGKYWMYWGDTDIFLATSDDLIKWSPLENEDGSLKKIFSPRKNMFDSDLVEPGPHAMLTDKGILLIYNSRNKMPGGDANLPDGNYAAGQILFDTNDPTNVLARSEDYFITPDKDYEITGQINNVCFVEGLVYFKGKWFLYYGTADSKIAVAVHGN
ncbi:MAG TPA: glycoside hydrolase family 130 protein [Cyclobacteriaceae bacterium]|nr:glycoside hydrolase family 130 protein [Cyclobacteriaceae bacterium]